MEIHEMNLQKRYFNYIKDGTKRIELRLFDEKRQEIQVGDIIEFQSGEHDFVYKKVVALHRAKNFEELFKKFDISVLADKSMTKQELLDELGKFYTKDKQEKYGVVGIEINNIKCPECGEKLVPIIYGMPIPEIIDMDSKKEVYLGGCEIIEGQPQPKWHCYECGCEFSKNLSKKFKPNLDDIPDNLL